MTHTKDMLAAALREIGLTKMADKAATGYYHDFLSPLDEPALTLMGDLLHAAKEEHTREGARAVLALRQRVLDGDFDATKEESDAWAASPEGREATRLLAQAVSNSLKR